MSEEAPTNGRKRIVIESVGQTTEDAVAHALSVIGAIVRGSKGCTCGGSSGSAEGKVSDV